MDVIMETNLIATYELPQVRVIDVEYKDVICISGNHEGITEIDWDD